MDNINWQLVFAMNFKEIQIIRIQNPSKFNSFLILGHLSIQEMFRNLSMMFSFIKIELESFISMY